MDNEKNIPEPGQLVLDESSNIYKLGDGKTPLEQLPPAKILNEDN
jgi:hypothetical protein